MRCAKYSAKNKSRFALLVSFVLRGGFLPFFLFASRAWYSHSYPVQMHWKKYKSILRLGINYATSLRALVLALSLAASASRLDTDTNAEYMRTDECDVRASGSQKSKYIWSQSALLRAFSMLSLLAPVRERVCVFVAFCDNRMNDDCQSRWDIVEAIWIAPNCTWHKVSRIAEPQALATYFYETISDVYTY